MTFLAFPEGGFQLGHATDAPIPGIWNVRMEDSRVQGRQGIHTCRIGWADDEISSELVHDLEISSDQDIIRYHKISQFFGFCVSGMDVSHPRAHCLWPSRCRQGGVREKILQLVDGCHSNPIFSQCFNNNGIKFSNYFNRLLTSFNYCYCRCFRVTNSYQLVQDFATIRMVKDGMSWEDFTIHHIGPPDLRRPVCASATAVPKWIVGESQLRCLNMVFFYHQMAVLGGKKDL